MYEIKDVCRICVQKSEKNEWILPKNNMFKFVVPNMDLKLKQNQKICEACLNTLKMSFEFKRVAYKNENMINNELKNTGIINLSVFLEKNASKKDLICRICLRGSPCNNIPLYSEENYGNSYRLVRNIIFACDIGLDLDLTEKPILCNNCWIVLQSFYPFKRLCQQSTEKFDKMYKKWVLKKKKCLKSLYVFQTSKITIKNLFKWQNALKMLTETNLKMIESNLEEQVKYLLKKQAKNQQTKKIQIHTEKIENISIKSDFSDSDEPPKSPPVPTSDAFIFTPIEFKDSKLKNMINKKTVSEAVVIDEKDNVVKEKFAFRMRKKSGNIVIGSIGGGANLKKVESVDDLSIEGVINRIAEKDDDMEENEEKSPCIKIERGNFNEEENKYVCLKCPFKTEYKHHLFRHLILHGNTDNFKRFQCMYCPYEAIKKQYLKSHLLQHDPNAMKFKCTHCDYLTNRKDRLRLHIETHIKDTLPRNFKCPKCPYTAIRKMNLKSHMITHEGALKYTCKECDYKTKRKSHLNTHMLKHADPAKVYIYNCLYCSYKAKRKHHLMVHTQKGCKGMKNDKNQTKNTEH